MARAKFQESDSPWKEAFDEFLRSLCELLFPKLYRAVDWVAAYENLQSELTKLFPRSATGTLTADRLYKVKFLTGAEARVIVHVEVQAQPDADFAERMYNYYARVRSKYRMPVVSLAVLADDRPNWHPTRFTDDCLGCRLDYRFLTAKLVKFKAATLECSPNEIAPFVAAHLESLRTKGQPEVRKSAKMRLVRKLYERGLDAEGVRRLFRLIDWVMELPPELRDEFRDELHAFERSLAVPYVTSIERAAKEEGVAEGKAEGKREGKAEGKREGKREGKKLGRREGLLEGLNVALKLRFGPAGSAYAAELRRVTDPDRLGRILAAVETAGSIDELRQL